MRCHHDEGSHTGLPSFDTGAAALLHQRVRDFRAAC